MIKVKTDGIMAMLIFFVPMRLLASESADCRQRMMRQHGENGKKQEPVKLQKWCLPMRFYGKNGTESCWGNLSIGRKEITLKGIVKKVTACALALTMTTLILAGCDTESADSAEPEITEVTETLAAEEQAGQSGDIVILYTNDVHCAVDDNLGYESLSAYKKLVEQQAEYVTMVDCGDSLQGEAIGAVSKGEYIVDIMNAVGYDLAILGNHEFDYGIDQLSYLIGESDAQYLSCNLTYYGEGDSLVDLIEPYEILSYGDVQVAYIGVSTPETMTKTTQSTFQDQNGNYVYDFCGSDAEVFYETVQGYIDECRDEGADYVILLTHLGVLETSSPYTSTELIAATTGVDAVLDGHSHTVIPSAIIANAEGDPVVLTSTGQKLQYIGRLTITADGDVSSTLISYVDYSDEEMASCLQEILQDYDDTMDTVVGESQITLTITSEDGFRMVRNRETNTGDFCADAYRAVTGADIAFVNGGGIRSGIEIGDVTYEELINVSPYGNSLCLVEATGQQILDALEVAYRYVTAEQNDGTLPLGEKGSFLQVSGLQLTIDTSIESSVVMDENSMFVSVDGEYRVKDVQVQQEDGSWSMLDPEETYTVASHSFIMQEAGEGMNMFLEDEFLIDGGITDYQVLINYMEDFLDGVIGEEYAVSQGRITVK